MKVSYKWLQEHIDGPLLKVEELANLFTFHLMEVEGTEKIGNDEVLDLKVLPDRAHYALSHWGIAKEISAIAKIKMKTRIYADISISPKVKDVSVKVTDKTFCPRYIARRIEGIKTGDSPLWLKEKLETIGARSINTIVDATNFVMFDIGQPLHAFDADKVVGSIHVRRAKDGEKIMTLDNKDITLIAEDFVIADDEGVLAIAGVKGGKKAEVTSETKNIILESANFSPISVRKTSVRVGIKNDAVKRFENGIPFVNTEKAINQVTNVIIDVAGNKETKIGKIVDEFAGKTEQIKLKITHSKIERRLGTKIRQDIFEGILDRLDITFTSKGDEYDLTIPSYRMDLRLNEDMVEEIGRIFGYDKIEGIALPDTGSRNILNSEYYISERIKNVLTTLGMDEVFLYTLAPKGDFEVLYPLASDKAFLRKSLKDGILKSTKAAILYSDLIGMKQIKMFELGKVFEKAKGESLHLGIAVSVNKKAEPAQTLLNKALESINTTLSTAITGKIEIDENIQYLEIDLSSVVQNRLEGGDIKDLNFSLGHRVDYKKFSPFPFIVRDIAVFSPKDTPADKIHDLILGAIKSSGTESLLARHDLFDVFEKGGKVSHAFRLIFQANDRTLTDDEINKVMAHVSESIKGAGLEVR